MTKITRFSFMLITVGAFALWAESHGAEQTRTISFWTAWQMPKYWLFIAFAAVGTALLFLGKMKKWPRLGLMALAFITFGILAELPLGEWVAALGLHPSPMCVIEKPFLFLNARGMIPVFFLSVFSVIAVMTVLSNKSFCSHACPIGAIQEMLHRIPTPKYRLPFKVTNSIRVLLFVIFVVLVFALNFSLFAYLNAFHLLHFEWEWTLILPALITLVGALFFFRPFCYTICPLGLFTWVLEQFSITRVKVDHDCTSCGKCTRDNVCPAVQPILDYKKVRPDCFGCGDCLEQCPQNSLTFKVQ